MAVLIALARLLRGATGVGAKLVTFFRSKAVAHSRVRLSGEVILASPLPLKIFGALLVVALSSFLVLICLGSYDRRETVRGWIIPGDGLVRVNSSKGGVVERLYVAEGDVVPEGQPIARLTTATHSSRGDVGEEMVERSNEEESAQEDEFAAKDAKLLARTREARRRRGALIAEADEIDRIVRILQSREELLTSQLARSERIAQTGYLSIAALENIKLAVLLASKEKTEAKANALNYRSRIADIDSSLDEISAEHAELAAQKVRSRAVFAQRRAQLEAGNATVTVSSVTGKVLGVPVTIGQSVSASTTIAILAPEHSTLKVELFVPSRAAGFVKRGQEVRLKYDAFPYQTFGAAKGVIESVSSTVLAPSDIVTPGIVLAQPSFRVRVRMERNSILAYGQVVPLQPGMLLNADVVIEKRNLVRWILDPIYAARRA